MKNNREEFLTYLRQHPFYPVFVQDLKKKRPPIPAHNPRADNTDDWKASSAQAQGYDLACSIFGLPLD